MSRKKKKIIETIEMPDSVEIYKSVRKEPVPPTQHHRSKKGKGSYKRKPKHSKKEGE